MALRGRKGDAKRGCVSRREELTMVNLMKDSMKKFDDELAEELDDGLDEDLRDACVASLLTDVLRPPCAPGVAALCMHLSCMLFY